MIEIIPPLSHDWQLFAIGWFACMMSVMPIMMLWIVGTEDFGKVTTIDELKTRVARLQQDNSELKTDNILHRQVIDSLLQERVQQVIKDVS